MAEVKSITLNRMKMITWRWLKMNERTVEFAVEGTAGTPEVLQPVGVDTLADVSAAADVKCGAGPEVDALLADVAVKGFSVAEGVVVEEPVRIKYELADGASTFDKYAVVVGDHAKVTLIMDVQSAADAAGYAAFQTRVKVGKGAEVSLVQIHRCATGYHIIDDFGADVDETGSFKAIQIAFTGKENDLGGHVELNGDKAQCFIRSGYLTADDHVMDINYYVNHTGCECETDIYTSGVLRDKCLKVFRTTIDFQPGAVKSQGEENENVLLMNNGVTNKTVPTILCGEEDVSGEHGCTVGRLADDLIFYLESRGIPNEEIYEMMAKARLEATIRQIPDEKTVEELVEFNNNL